MIYYKLYFSAIIFKAASPCFRNLLTVSSVKEQLESAYLWKCNMADPTKKFSHSTDIQAGMVLFKYNLLNTYLNSILGLCVYHSVTIQNRKKGTHNVWTNSYVS